MNNINVTAVLVLALEDFSNTEVAALTNAVTGWGSVHGGNFAFKKAVESHIIDEKGIPHDKEALLDALSHTIRKRMYKGEWE